MREALAPAVRARYNRHIHGIMIQGIMLRIVFVNEAAIYATKVAAQEPPLQGRLLCLQLCLLSLICCCYAATRLQFVLAETFDDMDILLLRYCSQPTINLLLQNGGRRLCSDD